MRLLLDTHALLWWGHADRRLGRRAAREIGSADNQVYISAVSAMEVTTKHRLGKLPDAYQLAADFAVEVEALGFLPLSVTLQHAQTAGGLPVAHKDPFDRLLIAQAMLDELVLVSNETVFDSFGVSRLW